MEAGLEGQHPGGAECEQERVAVGRPLGLDLFCPSQPSSDPAWGEVDTFIRGSAHI